MHNICNINWIKSPIIPQYKNQEKGEIKIIDLFSGCGGMTQGAIEAIGLHGYSPKINLAIDLYPEAIDLYNGNFRGNLTENGEILNFDITKLASGNIGDELSGEEINLRNKYYNTDIILAGPPCQGHSNLNNHTRRNDPRNELYLKVVRFAEIVNPKVIIIENVSSVLHDKNDVVSQSRKFLENMGYFVNQTPIILNMVEYGLAQNRKRHVQIATKRDILDKIDLSFYKQNQKNIWDYISDLENKSALKGRFFDTSSNPTPVNIERMRYLFENNLYDLPNELRPPCHQFKKHSYTACYGRLSKDTYAPTITSGFGSMGQGRFVHPTQERLITPHEAARIQGFPDFFSFDLIKNRSMLQTIIANAVPPKIIAMIIDQCIINNAFI